MSVCQFDPNTKVPICEPIRTLESLLKCDPTSDKFCRPTVKLDTSKYHLPNNRPKTLVCHDMAGGYLDDRFVQGSADGEAYRLYHWQYVDIFVYFSHHFITVPPPGWINAGHKHNTLVLGTVITEWNEGKERCDKLLGSEEYGVTVAGKLVEICLAYGFDGWLINIENPIQDDKVQYLKKFVAHLTAQMHDAIPHSQVIWYDSVTKEGKLRWQDELNDHNCLFFDCCDGIFLNYGWNTKKLERSAEYCQNKGRPFDVYVGVDVFGRGCFGGGGYNTDKAVAAAGKQNLSVAIFAQGWVYEKLGKEAFVQHNDKFWQLLDPFLPKHNYTSVPLSTSFCQGVGKKFYIAGKVASQEPWSNLTCQNLQPSFVPGDNVTMSPADRLLKMQMHWWNHDAYLGGGCLYLGASFAKEESVLSLKLLKTGIPITAEPMFVSYSFKPLHPHEEYDFAIELVIKTSQQDAPILLCAQDAEVKIQGTRPQGACKITPNIVKKVPAAYHIDADSSWVTRKFVLSREELQSKHGIDGIAELGEIRANIIKNDCECLTDLSILLGQIQILPLSAVDEVPLLTNLHAAVTETLKTEELDHVRKVVHLQWSFPLEHAKYFLVYVSENGTGMKRLLGQTYVCNFIASLEISSVCKSFQFTVQPVLKSGFVISWSTLPVTDVQVPEL